MLDRIKNQPPGGAEETEGLDLHSAINFLWRRWKFIGGVTALAGLIGLVHLYRETPVYTAAAQILLEPGKSKAPGREQEMTEMLDLSAVEGQMAIIRSTVMLRRVVEKDRLVDDPEFGSAPAAAGAGSLAGAVKAIFSKEARPEEAAPARKAGPSDNSATGIPADVLSAIGKLQGALQVSRAGQANLITVSFTAADAARAARLANAIADGYVVDQLDSRFEAASRASAWLNDRLVELRKQLRESEEAVAQFRAQNNLRQSAGGVSTLSQEQLGQLNANLVAARTEVAAKKAQLDMLRRTENRGVSSLTELNSAALGDLRKQAADLSRQEADLLTRYSEKHPSIVNLRAQMHDLRRNIETEIQRAASKINEEYQLAKAREDAMAAALREATGQTDLDASKAITLRELERSAAVNKSLFEDFLQRSRVTQAQSTFEARDSRIITPALPPGAPSAPKKTQAMAIAILLGLAVGVGGAYVLELLNVGFTTPRQIEDMLHLPLLASISSMRDGDRTVDGKLVNMPMLVTLRPMSRFSESVRSLRSGVQMADVDNPPKVLQITSTVPGEGKSTLALTIAASAAQSGAKVLFMDCDLRHPSSSKFFGLEKEKGLVDLLIGEAAVEDVVRFEPSVNFWMTPAGGKTQNPSDLLGSERLKHFVDDLRENFDLIIIDTPPMGPVVDPIVVAQHLADQVVYVVRWASTARDMVQRSVAQLSGHAKIAGVVFNHVVDKQAQRYSKYAYGNYYGGNRYYKNYYQE